jgi:hypothetical protein
VKEKSFRNINRFYERLLRKVYLARNEKPPRQRQGLRLPEKAVKRTFQAMLQIIAAQPR